MLEDISYLPETEIKSDCYVIHTLEAALWCLLTTNSFESSVLKAVNLGKDADTTAAVVGGLAGIEHSFEGIPNTFVSALARREDIDSLCTALFESLHPTK